MLGRSLNSYISYCNFKSTIILLYIACRNTEHPVRPASSFNTPSIQSLFCIFFNESHSYALAFVYNLGFNCVISYLPQMAAATLQF